MGRSILGPGVLERCNTFLILQDVVLKRVLCDRIALLGQSQQDMGPKSFSLLCIWYTCTHTHTHTHTHTEADTHTDTDKDTHTDTHTDTDTETHTHTETYTHPQTYTRICFPPGKSLPVEDNVSVVIRNSRLAGVEGASMFLSINGKCCDLKGNP